MSKGTLKLIVGACVLTLAGSAVAAGPERAVARPKPQLTVTKIEAARITQATGAVFSRIGRNVSGKISWPAANLGKPTGTATEACGRVHAFAMKDAPKTPDQLFGTQDLVKDVTAKPVDANDVTKGCTYQLTQLPANVALYISASYDPNGGKWTPACEGGGGVKGMVSTNKTYNLLLPDSPVQVSLDMVLDYVFCEGIY